jgi:hypothetical protein
MELPLFAHKLPTRSAEISRFSYFITAGGFVSRGVNFLASSLLGFGGLGDPVGCDPDKIVLLTKPIPD